MVLRRANLAAVNCASSELSRSGSAQAGVEPRPETAVYLVHRARAGQWLPRRRAWCAHNKARCAQRQRILVGLLLERHCSEHIALPNLLLLDCRCWDGRARGDLACVAAPSRYGQPSLLREAMQTLPSANGAASAASVRAALMDVPAAADAY